MIMKKEFKTSLDKIMKRLRKKFKKFNKIMINLNKN